MVVVELTFLSLSLPLLLLLLLLLPFIRLIDLPPKDYDLPVKRQD